MVFFHILVEHVTLTVGVAVVASLASYIIYQRFLHPLASYPGPLLASLTDLWQVHQFLSLKQPYTLTDLHEKYGPFVRYSPDKISMTDEEAVTVIYQKGCTSIPKTEFYDAYGAAHPNVFGMRDETVSGSSHGNEAVTDVTQAHSLRRRYMSNCFSMTYIKQLEQYLDLNMGLLRRKIQGYCDTHEVFDLKQVIHFYVIDVLGELAFGQSFGVQLAHDESLAPPVVEHSLLAAVTGAWPAMTSKLKRWLPLVPYKPLQGLFQGRARVARIASECVKRRLEEAAKVEEAGTKEIISRKDILTDLILARNPDTGARLTQADLETEAFGYIIAGTHTTSATTSLLLYHLLHNPNHLQTVVSELDGTLSDLQPEQEAYPVSTLEASLPFTRNCIKENFRLTPVFTMPLARRITQPHGVVIADRYLPQGVSNSFPLGVRRPLLTFRVDFSRNLQSLTTSQSIDFWRQSQHV